MSPPHKVLCGTWIYKHGCCGEGVGGGCRGRPPDASPLLTWNLQPLGAHPTPEQTSPCLGSGKRAASAMRHRALMDTFIVFVFGFVFEENETLTVSLFADGVLLRVKSIWRGKRHCCLGGLWAGDIFAVRCLEQKGPKTSGFGVPSLYPAPQAGGWCYYPSLCLQICGISFILKDLGYFFASFLLSCQQN